MCLLTYLFQTSTAAGSGAGDQGEILKLQRTIKVNIFIVSIIIYILCSNQNLKSGIIDMFYINYELNDCVCVWGCVYYLTLKFPLPLWSFIMSFQ